MSTPQERGGRVRAIAQRAEAITRFYAADHRCLACKNQIQVREGEKAGYARRKIFCSKSCAARHHNIRGLCGRKKRPIEKQCARCGGQTLKAASRKFCSKCWDEERARIGEVCKGECPANLIRAHARYILKQMPNVCVTCNYSAHVEICHLVPVSDFPGSAKLREINSRSNLVLLCPNCHWEMDHGLWDAA